MPKEESYEGLSGAQKLLITVFLILAVWYLNWRLTTFNSNAMFFSVGLYCAEIYGLVTTCMHLFMNWRLKVRTPPIPESELTVDVFIPTYNEDTELVRKTLIAAKHMDYTHETWLLDDGNRAEMKILAKEIGVNYIAREDNAGAKAGNLNNALRKSTGQFIAIFDADHAPSGNFLLHTLGYFRNPKVAFIQTPQDFYNLDSYQHRWSKKRRSVWTEQSLFFRVIQRGKDYWNAAFFCGSCAIMRRDAIEGIGGFAEETVTEDLHTSIRLHKKGWQSVYHSESLAFGIAPSGIVPFLKQRIRWGQGAMHVWKIEPVLTSRKLTWAQKINYFASMTTYFDGWQRAIFYLAPIIVLTTGVMPISAIGIEFLWHFVPYYLLTFWVFEEISRGYGRSLYIEQYNMGRFAAFCWSTLSLVKNRLKFQVTPKGLTSQNTTLFYLVPQLMVLVLSASAIIVGIVFFISFSHLPLGGTIANIAWASANGFLAFAIVRFSMRQNHNKRTSYRFQIPLPAQIQTGNTEQSIVTVDDISLSGCRLYGPLSKLIAVGSTVSGTLYLPSGTLDFTSKVTALIPGKSPSGNSYLKGVGCAFTHNQQQRDALSLFLYGSDLQWRIMHLSERINTPIQWLENLLFPATRTTTDIGQQPHWSTMQYTVEEQQSMDYLGLISTKEADQTIPQYILLFQSIDNDSSLSGRILTRTSHTLFEATVNQRHAIDNRLGPLYQYNIDSFKIKSVWHSSLTNTASESTPCPTHIAK